MKVTIIVASSQNGVIGKDNTLPWHLPADLKYFKEVTTGHHIIMGRKTWESIGRPLPNRTSIVITRDPNYQANGAIVVHNLAAAISVAAQNGEIEAFIIGGAEIIQEVISKGLATHFHLTEIQTVVTGEMESLVFLPALDPNLWLEVSRSSYLADEKNNLNFDFVEYEKVVSIAEYEQAQNLVSTYKRQRKAKIKLGEIEKVLTAYFATTYVQEFEIELTTSVFDEPVIHVYSSDPIFDEDYDGDFDRDLEKISQQVGTRILFEPYEGGK